MENKIVKAIKLTKIKASTPEGYFGEMRPVGTKADFYLKSISRMKKDSTNENTQIELTGILQPVVRRSFQVLGGGVGWCAHAQYANLSVNLHDEARATKMERFSVRIIVQDHFLERGAAFRALVSARRPESSALSAASTVFIRN